MIARCTTSLCPNRKFILQEWEWSTGSISEKEKKGGEERVKDAELGPGGGGRGGVALLMLSSGSLASRPC